MKDSGNNSLQALATAALVSSQGFIISVILSGLKAGLSSFCSNTFSFMFGSSFSSAHLHDHRVLVEAGEPGGDFGAQPEHLAELLALPDHVDGVVAGRVRDRLGQLPQPLDLRF